MLISCLPAAAVVVAPDSFLFRGQPRARPPEDFASPPHKKGQTEHLARSSEPRKFNPGWEKGTLNGGDAQAAACVRACLLRGRPGGSNNAAAF